ncbi:hypothetical protein AB6A23_10420 [Paenibacillus tarimensis]
MILTARLRIRKNRKEVTAVWYLLAAVGLIVIVVGAYYSVKIMRNQQHREFDKRLPESIAAHPAARNPIFIFFIVTPVAVFLLSILAWLVFGR